MFLQEFPRARSIRAFICAVQCLTCRQQHQAWGDTHCSIYKSVFIHHIPHTVCWMLQISLFIIVSQGKPIEFAGVDDSTARWVQEFSVKPYANPAKLESIDGLKSLCSLESECISAFVTLGYVWCFRCPLSGAADSRLSRGPKRSGPQRIPRTDPVPLHFSSKWGSASPTAPGLSTFRPVRFSDYDACRCLFESCLWL